MNLSVVLSTFDSSLLVLHRKYVIDFDLRARCIIELNITKIKNGGDHLLSIGEFSHICKVSTKTLRYYAKIGLILPDEINPKNGYRYYSIEQLKTMLFINRLKAYNFSLEEIKTILESEESQDEKLYLSLTRKKKKSKHKYKNLKKL